MERQIPKNVRQIGNVSDTPKIYVEDYVDTFFSQLCDKAGESPVGAFLVGDIQSTEDEEYVYIYGAIQMHELKLSGTEYVLDEDTWKHAYEDCKQYFEDGEMLGWFVAHAGVPLSAEENVTALHKKSFPKKNTVFIIKDPGEKEEAYFVHKLDDLMEIGGHYTYYEKNPCMQNYMISARKKNGASPTETVEDQAAKDFRSIVRSREEQMMKQRSNRMMYALSTSLVLLVVIMGVATMNNFDKMRSVQNTLENLSGTVASDDGQVQQTDGKVSSSGTPAASGEAGAQGDAGTDGNDQAQPDGQAPGQNQPGGRRGNPREDRLRQTGRPRKDKPSQAGNPRADRIRQAARLPVKTDRQEETRRMPETAPRHPRSRPWRPAEERLAREIRKGLTAPVPLPPREITEATESMSWNREIPWRSSARSCTETFPMWTPSPG